MKVIDMKRKKITCEFLLKASPAIVYQFLSDPACLVRWFCDRVDIEEDRYTFDWNGSEEVAILIEDHEEKLLRFVWEEAESPSEYLEFAITTSPVTDQTILTITDYGDEDEEKDQQRFWDAQIKKMNHVMGA
jgi:uncharacterized protein YndB with AHSA1/START domain